MMDNKFKVLIVDDVPKNIQVAANILQEQGYQMAFAQNGKTALSLVQSNKFDLILLDIMMPGMDGFEVCEQLKKDPATSNIPIIFLTAKTDTESIVKGFESGAMDYVTKPFNGSELLLRVKTHLELNHTKEKLREANATKDKFFSIIAHDLKNPFNAVLGLANLLTDQYDAFDERKKKVIIQDICQSSEQGYKLLENLLDWSRMQTGKVEWNPDKIDLYTYAFENTAFLKSNADSKKISLVSNIDRGAMVYADPNMTTMIIRNLVSNAIKFTKEGGEVTISSKNNGDHEEVTVSDNGVGIKDENKEKLFRIDVHHSTLGTSKEVGTGLGLILCKEFAEKNGGEIWVESEFGKGSNFRFTLPKKK
ncbi:MAG: hybrid sensor histidine kinase/response regulator [Desulfobacterales bacterium]|nr:hybrid sensor histidine kinase/response regulator [Desulfobacterales bacterium]